MKNHKGQVLVLFILVMPLLLFAMIMIINTAYGYIERRHIENNVKEMVRYGLEHIARESETLKQEMEVFLRKNVDRIETLQIEIKDEEIRVCILSSYDTLFFKTKVGQIQLCYRGYFLDNEQRIIKE